MYKTEWPNVFRKIVPRESWPDQEEEEIKEKIHRAYVKMKKKSIGKGKTFQAGKLRMETRTK